MVDVRADGPVTRRVRPDIYDLLCDQLTEMLDSLEAIDEKLATSERLLTLAPDERRRKTTLKIVKAKRR